MSWRSTMNIAGFGSISQRHGSADPDPHQNVLDHQHWLVERSLLQPVTPTWLKMPSNSNYNAWCRCWSWLCWRSWHSCPCPSPWLSASPTCPRSSTSSRSFTPSGTKKNNAGTLLIRFIIWFYGQFCNMPVLDLDPLFKKMLFRIQSPATASSFSIIKPIPFLMHSFFKCSEFVTFWYGPGSADPYHRITDLDPDLIKSLSRCKKTSVFLSFFYVFLTVGRFTSVFIDTSHKTAGNQFCLLVFTYWGRIRICKSN